jgi:hypothetical protein
MPGSGLEATLNMGKLRFGKGVAPHDRHPVAWYQPYVLAAAGRELVSSIDHQRNRDLRESYQLPLAVIDRSGPPAGDGDFWFDFIADTGDGGNATYSVASLALRDQLDVARAVPEGGEASLSRLPRGELLVFGGDLAYPSASSQQYRYRFVEMFEAARSTTGSEIVRGRQPTVVALAQNHDWMDSAATFNRYFIRHKAGQQFLGADVPQMQSYFCVKLPKGWWLLGLDFALTGDIDRDQYEQFECLVNGRGLECRNGQQHAIGADDRVILVYPEPYWTREIGDGADPTWPARYQRLEGLLEDRIALRLAGDLHHYMRWHSDSHGSLIICGTGGAFTHPTHTYTTTRDIGTKRGHSDDAIPAEPADAVMIGHDDGTASTFPFKRIEASVFPPAAESRRRTWDNITALFTVHPNWRDGNAWFALVLGLFYWFNAYLNAAPFVESFRPDGFGPIHTMDLSTAFDRWLAAMTLSPFAFLLNLAMVVVCVVMGREASAELPPTLGRWRHMLTTASGLLHAALHFLAVFLLYFGIQHAVTWAGPVEHPVLHGLAVGVPQIVLGSVAGGLIFGTYLAVMSRLGLLTNNGYSALGIEDYKGFLRFRIDMRSGDLHGHFIALEKVAKRWRRRSGAGAMPVWEPETGNELKPRLHDHFVIRGR